MATVIFCKSACHLAYRGGHVPRRDTRARPRALGSEGVSSSRERSLPRLCRARAERASSHRLAHAPRTGDVLFCVARAHAARLVARDTFSASKVGVDARVSRPRTSSLPRARHARARVEPRASSRTTLTPAAARTRCPSPPPPDAMRAERRRAPPAAPSTAPSTTTATSSPRAR